MEIVSLLSPFLGKIVFALGLLIAGVTTYFGVKYKGKLEERAHWEKAQAEAKAAQLKRQLEAVAQDDLIDKQVEKEIENIKQKHQVDHHVDPKPGDPFHF